MSNKSWQKQKQDYIDKIIETVLDHTIIMGACDTCRSNGVRAVISDRYLVKTVTDRGQTVNLIPARQACREELKERLCDLARSVAKGGKK
jgi:hypothetical protein